MTHELLVTYQQHKALEPSAGDLQFLGGSVISIFSLDKNNTRKVRKQGKKTFFLPTPTQSPLKKPKDTAYHFRLTLSCVLENKQRRATLDLRLVTVRVMSNQRIFYLPVLHLFLKLSMYSAAVTKCLIFVIQPFSEGAQFTLKIFTFLTALFQGFGALPHLFDGAKRQC